MELLNCIGLETRHGYRTFELYAGDLTEPDAVGDLLIVSAFAGGYRPVPDTLLGALNAKWGLDLGKLERDLNLCDSLGFWLSSPLPASHFKRLMCVEILGGRFSIAEALNNVFVALAIADARGVEIRTVALPLLGAGNQGIDPDEAMASLLPAVRKALEQNYSLQRVLFIDKDAPRASALSSAMNRILGRPKVELPKGRLILDLKMELCAQLDGLAAKGITKQYPVLQEMRRLFSQDDVRSFEIGMLARRLVELIVDDLLGPSTGNENLAMRIGRVREAGVATWIQSYMHTLRLFGNESAHEKNKVGQKPPYVSEEDLAICLFCMQRMLDFWVTYGKTSHA